MSINTGCSSHAALILLNVVIENQSSSFLLLYGRVVLLLIVILGDRRIFHHLFHSFIKVDFPSNETECIVIAVEIDGKLFGELLLISS